MQMLALEPYANSGPGTLRKSALRPYANAGSGPMQMLAPTQIRPGTLCSPGLRNSAGTCNASPGSLQMRPSLLPGPYANAGRPYAAGPGIYAMQA
ncbi:hypothetical protein TNCT_719181 [Trichonephila clavata]|uniref:Uncharacterized protein n=1 Tax=Trichonephila clavata TaxID=2740835 RepID=A0A8X6ITK3_TRICU|nr:hypothetical protein TNCT_719181 [Trichonephila clavata]